MDKKTDKILQLYSDESGNHSDRFRSIGIISGSSSSLNNLRSLLTDILESNFRESIEFKNIDGDSKKQKVVELIIAEGLKTVIEQSLKIDVLTWDCSDSRHSISKIDKEKNFEIMYYHIITKTLHRWQSKYDKWAFYPDQKYGVHWDDIKNICANTNLNRKLIDAGVLFEDDIRFFTECVGHYELNSSTEPLIQFIDIITGLIRLSFCSSDDYYMWLNTNAAESEQGELFTSEVETAYSRGVKAKFKCMKLFHDNCKKYTCQVNFSRDKYFQTFHLNGPLNLWFYKPKDYDRAPVKTNI